MSDAADLPDLLPGMQRAFERTGVPQLVRWPWPAPYAERYEDLTCTLTWDPIVGYRLNEGRVSTDSAWRLKDIRYRDRRMTG